MWFVLNKPHSLQDLKELLLTSLCVTPQSTFKGLVEFIPRQIRLGSVAQKGPIQCQEGSLNIVNG